MPTVKFFGRNGKDFDQIGSVRLQDGELQIQGNRAVLERLLALPIAAPGGKSLLTGTDNPEEWLAAAPKMFNGSAFYAEAVAEENGSPTQTQNAPPTPTTNGNRPTKAETPGYGKEQQRSDVPKPSRRARQAKADNPQAPTVQGVREPSMPPLPEYGDRQQKSDIPIATKPSQSDLDPEGQPWGTVLMQACPECGGALSVNDTHVWCGSVPCEYSKLLTDLVPDYTPLQHYMRIDVDAQQSKEVLTHPAEWTGDRCATCKHFAVHPKEEVGLCAERHMQLNVTRQQWCPKFKEGDYADSLWREIQRLLPVNAPTPEKLPAIIGELESGVEVVLYDGNKVVLAKRKQASNRGYDEQGHLDTVLGANTAEDPDIYRAVWGKPKPEGSPEQIYADVQTSRANQRYTLAHEGIEAPLMQAGMEYDPAHEFANEVERERREQDQ